MAECNPQGRTVQKNVTPAVQKTAKCHWARPPHTRTKPSTWRRPRRKNKACQKETNASKTMDNKHSWTTLSVRAPTTHANRQVAMSNKPNTKNDAKWFVWTLSLHLIEAILFPKLELQAWSFSRRPKIFAQHNGTC